MYTISFVIAVLLWGTISNAETADSSGVVTGMDTINLSLDEADVCRSLACDFLSGDVVELTSDNRDSLEYFLLFTVESPGRMSISFPHGSRFALNPLSCFDSIYSADEVQGCPQCDTADYSCTVYDDMVYWPPVHEMYVSQIPGKSDLAKNIPVKLKLVNENAILEGNTVYLSLVLLWAANLDGGSTLFTQGKDVKEITTDSLPDHPNLMVIGKNGGSAVELTRNSKMSIVVRGGNPRFSTFRNQTLNQNVMFDPLGRIFGKHRQGRKAELRGAAGVFIVASPSRNE